MSNTPTAPAANAPPVRINLYSDTQTKPSPAMKDAMMAAEVGDEQHGSDPTVHELCDRVASLLGKEAAVFLPSGTMCNVAAILVHCRPGDEVVAHEHSHILISEGGAHAAFAGVQIMQLTGPRGMFTLDTLRQSVRAKSRHTPEQRLLSVEQTANRGGGTVWPRDQLDEVLDFAHEQGWATHMDGARLMNAAVASGTPASAFRRKMRLGVDRLHQGPGGTARGRAGRQPRLHRSGLALEAASRRIDAPGRHLCRSLHPCTRPQR